VGHDRSGGGSQRCACGLLIVGSCASNATECASAATDRVSRRTGAGACDERDGTEVQCDDNDGRRRVTRAFFNWCISDGAVLDAGCGCFSLRHGVITVQWVLSSMMKFKLYYCYCLYLTVGPE